MNSKQKSTEAILSLVAHLRPGGLGASAESGSFKAWNFSGDGLHVKQEDAGAYRVATRLAYDLTCKGDYTLEDFEKHIVNYFSEGILKGATPSTAEVDSFLEGLAAEETSIYVVTRDIRGLRFESPQVGPRRLGPFSIYFYPFHKDLLDGTSGEGGVFREGELHYLLGVEVEAKSGARAIEKADELFEAFEKILRFIVGSTAQYDVSVLRAHGRYEQNAYVFMGGVPVSANYSWVGAVQTVPIDDKYFDSSALGYDRLWNTLSTPTPAALQVRVLKAVQWLGEAYAERDRAGAFIKSAIALEVLFTANEKGLISASILSSISETVACLLGHDVEERLAVERRVKKHYGIRSSVAHAGKQDVEQQDLEDFMLLVRHSIGKLLSTPALQTISSVEGLYEYLKKSKYSFPAI